LRFVSACGVASHSRYDIPSLVNFLVCHFSLSMVGEIGKCLRFTVVVGEKGKGVG